MFEYKESYSKLTNVCLNITDACNLQCRYCFVNQNPHFMKLETAKAAVDWLIENKRWKNQNGFPKEKVHITYFGGEPTLLWDEIIVPLTRYGFETYPNEITFGITTNGTLLSEERIKFMAAYHITPLLSIDGAPYTQNYNRPCHNSDQYSFDLVKNNIPILLQYFPNTTFRATIDEHTVHKTFENYIFAQYMGFKNIYMIPNGRTEWSQKNLFRLANEYKRIYVYMMTYFKNNQTPPINCSCINDSFKYLKDIMLKEKPRRSCVRCGLGTGMGSIGYDGKIYGCQEQNSQEEASFFYIGDIEHGINIEKHSKFLEEYLNVNTVTCGEHQEFCTTCPLKSICGTLNCPSSSYDLFQSFDKDNYVHCYWLRIMVEYASVMTKYLEDNDVFKQFLIKNCDYQFKEGGNENGM